MAASSTPLGSDRRQTEGFTLVELLVCLAILSVLYGVAAYSSSPLRHRPPDGPAAEVRRLRAAAIESQRPTSAWIPYGAEDSVLVRARPDGRVIGWPRRVRTAAAGRPSRIP